MVELKITHDKSSHYGPRTFQNASAADLTVAIATDFTTHGEVLTKKAAKKYLAIPAGTIATDAARLIYRALVRTGSTSINLAGNGIYTLSKSRIKQADVNQYVYSIFRVLLPHYPLDALRSGGQTGVDLAAGVVGPILNIPTTLHFPNGFRQRFHDGKDITQTEAEVRLQVEEWQRLLLEKLQCEMDYGVSLLDMASSYSTQSQKPGSP